MQALAPFPVSSLSAHRAGHPRLYGVSPGAAGNGLSPGGPSTTSSQSSPRKAVTPDRGVGCLASMGFDVQPRLLGLIDQTVDLAEQFLCQRTRRGAPKTARPIQTPMEKRQVVSMRYGESEGDMP